MQDSNIIDELGGTSKVAAMFGISAPSVSDWRKYGIPLARRHALALMFPDKVPAAWLPKVEPEVKKKNCEAA